MKYGFVRAHRDEFRVCRMCGVLKVSRSGYVGTMIGVVEGNLRGAERIKSCSKRSARCTKVTGRLTER